MVVEIVGFLFFNWHVSIIFQALPVGPAAPIDPEGSFSICFNDLNSIRLMAGATRIFNVYKFTINRKMCAFITVDAISFVRV